MTTTRPWWKTVLGIVFTALMLFPVYWMANVSLTKTSDLRANPPHWFPWDPTFEGYARVLEQQLPALGTSLIVGLGTVALTIAIAAPAGYAIAQLHLRGRRTLNFLLLVAQFRSLIEPLNMVFSLSLMFTAIVAGLLLSRQTFSTVSILAVVILAGMMMTVAVLLIDLVLRLRAQGMDRDEAILTAGPIRLRPILMTSFITVVVLIPVAFFPRTGIDAYAPLATVVIAGLSVGTVLALFVVPVLHTYTDDLARLVRAGWRRLTGRRGTDRDTEVPA